METNVKTQVLDIYPIHDLKKGIQAGNYEKVDSLIEKKCCLLPVEAKKQKSLSIALFRFGEFMKNREILRRAGKMHCRPGNWTHLLGFVKKYPDEQCTYSIAVLGSVIVDEHGNDCVLYAYKDMLRGKRLLGLYPIKSGFHDLFKFIFIDGHKDTIIELL